MKVSAELASLRSAATGEQREGKKQRGRVGCGSDDAVERGREENRDMGP